ncbi:dentin sialophosphoprotein-like isoform X2 [Mercenaria mercenaria]|uniref:dentin sialophosphoprotein-like isoform X2 n=1 Tax=Mercenaria mercenaria TaxID=6596 RepID=UPI00234F5106|nr:dentin sialophosphoprotein-like isoform X2 [Mercenaria mercenaria]
MSSLKHRITYLEKNHPELHKVIIEKQFDSLESLTSKVETLSQGVVKKEGKQFSISVMIELPPSETALIGNTQAEKIKTTEGTDAPIQKDLQASSEKKTDTAKASTNTKNPSEGKSTDQQLSSIMSTKSQENKFEEPRKKLPAWVKIPRLPKKDSQAPANTDTSPAKTKDASNDKKVKTDDAKESAKEQPEKPSDSKKQDEQKRSRSQDRRRSSSRNRDRRSSRHSPRRKDGERDSKDKTRKSAERGSRRYSREDSSHKRGRSRSRDKDRRDAKSPRTGHLESTGKCQKERDKGDTKNSTSIENTKSSDKSTKDEAAVSTEEAGTKSLNPVPVENIENVSDNEILPENVKPVSEETDQAIDIDDFSLEELELIGKSIEEQMEEVDDLIHIEDDTKENKTEKNSTLKITAPVKESKTDERGNECVIEIKSNVDEDLQIKDKIDTPDEVVIDLVPEENHPKITTQRKKPSDSCVVEITMASSPPEKACQSNSKVGKKMNKVSMTDDTPVVEIDMNVQQNKLDESCNVTLEIEEPKQNTEYTKVVQDNVKEVSKMHADKSESRQMTKSKLPSLSTEEVQFHSKPAEVRIDVVADTDERNKSHSSSKKEDDNEITSDAKEDTSDDGTTDFDDFIASQLGEEFVTVDDFTETDTDTPIEVECTNEEKVVKSDILPKNVTEISLELEEIENNSKTGKKKEICPKSKSVENRSLKELQGKQNVSETKVEDIQISDTKSDKETKLNINNDVKSSEFNQIDTSKKPEIPSSQDENINTNNFERSQSVCVVEISMETPQMSENSAVPEKTGCLFDPYDDSGDMEFILNEDFETVDETEEIGTDLGTTVMDSNMEKEIDVCDKSESINVGQEQAAVRENVDNQIASIAEPVINTEQIEVSKETNIHVEKTAAAVELQENVVHAITDKTENVREDHSPLVITSFPVDDEDDDDIEEIFLSGDFVTIDEHEEDEPSPAVDNTEEDVDFNPDDFVTVDEVDIDAAADRKQFTSQLKEHESSTETKKDHSKHSSSRSGGRSSRSREKSVSRNGCRSSRDKSESKKSSHSSSRMRDTERRSSSKKRDGSRTSRHSSPEKSTKPSSSSTSSRTSRGSGTSVSAHKSGSSGSNRSGSQKETLTSSVEIRSSDSRKEPSDKQPSGIEVNFEVLNKQSGKEQASVSESTRSSDRLRSYTVKQDGSPRKIDTQSFLGIPIKSAAESASSKQLSKTGQEKEKSSTDKNVKPDSNRNTHFEDRGKASVSVKPDQTSVNKQSNYRTRSATNVSDDKLEDSKSSHDRHKDRNEKDVWVLGDSIPYWAGVHTKSQGKPNLGLQDISVVWWGVCGLRWKDFRHSVEAQMLSSPPSLIFIHLGGDDLVSENTIEIRHMIETEISYLREAFPEAVIVWVDILQRQHWSGSLQGKKPIEKKRKRLNRIGRKIVTSSGTSDIISPDIDEQTFFQDDGVHLNLVGLEFYLDCIRDSIIKILRN